MQVSARSMQKKEKKETAVVFAQQNTEMQEAQEMIGANCVCTMHQIKFYWQIIAISYLQAQLSPNQSIPKDSLPRRKKKEESGDNKHLVNKPTRTLQQQCKHS